MPGETNVPTVNISHDGCGSLLLLQGTRSTLLTVDLVVHNE